MRAQASAKIGESSPQRRLLHLVDTFPTKTQRAVYGTHTRRVLLCRGRVHPQPPFPKKRVWVQRSCTYIHVPLPPPGTFTILCAAQICVYYCLLYPPSPPSHMVGVEALTERDTDEKEASALAFYTNPRANPLFSRLPAFTHIITTVLVDMHIIKYTE